MDSEELYNKILEDDTRHLKQLFDLYYNDLCIYIFQFTKDMADAEDIVQSIFVKLWTRKHRLKIKTSIKAYLFRSAYNHYIDQLRKEKRKNLFLQELQYQGLLAQIEEEESDQEEELNQLEKFINELPQKCKEILLLSKKEGLANKEIARCLNISVKTVESQISIAFRKIRKKFE